MNSSQPAISDLFRLDRRVALVTGASQGIGASIARAFAEAGATVVIVARGVEQLAQTAQDISRATGAVVVPVAADITDTAQRETLLSTVQDKVGALHVLVNNAYAADHDLDRDILDTGEDTWYRCVEANLMGPFRLCQGIVPEMRRAGGGSVINVVSGSGLLPTPGLVAYGSTKAALWMMTRYLAKELAPDVRVNALCPGVVNDVGVMRSDREAEVIAGVPFGRAGQSDELRGAALYLASDASSYTSGALLVCNGARDW